MDHTERLYTDEAAPIIEDLGGKMGGLEFLRRNVPVLADRILPAQHVKSGEALSQLSLSAGPDSRYIVRGSHANDFQGLVDVLETHVVKTRLGVSDAIANIRNEADSELVMAYAQHENPSYDGNVVVGVQPFMPSSDWKRTNVVEHPNCPGEYVISNVTPVPSNLSGLSIDTAVYVGGEDMCMRLPGEGKHPVTEERSRVLMEIYKLIERSNLVQDDHVFQVEFLDNGEDFYIAQVRAFMRKQVADFELDGKRRLVFGVTPPEGVVLPVLQSPDGFDSDGKPLSHSERWAFLKTEHRESLSLEFLPKDMAALLISQSFHTGIVPSLAHHHFRYAQRADVTVFENGFRPYCHDFTGLIFGESSPDMVEFHLLNVTMMGRMEEKHPMIAEKDMLYQRAGLQGLPVRIISDGRTANVDVVE